MSTSSREVIVFDFDINNTEKHPDADNLRLFNVPNTCYLYVLNQNDWQYKGKCVWIPPDTLLDVSRPEFSFLATEAKYTKDSKTTGDDKRFARIKARKIRGCVSYGILARYDGSLPIGGNAYEELNCGHYDPDIADASSGNGFSLGGECAAAPSGHYPDYEVENFRKCGQILFQQDEPCLVTIKLNGSSCRFMYDSEGMHVGSHHQWKKRFSEAPKLTLEDLIEKTKDETRAREIYERAVVSFKVKKNEWWQLLESYPSLQKFCEQNQGYCVYGELYGAVKHYLYDCEPGKPKFAAFDIKKPNGFWMDAQEFLDTCKTWDIPTVPVVGQFPFDFAKFLQLAEGDDNLIPGSTCIKEGVIARTMKERYHPKYGRASLKIINTTYSLSKK